MGITFYQTAYSNNIALSSVVLTGQNTTAGVNNAANFSQVQFNLTWENSWRLSTGPANWDAAWVFVKFQVGTSNPTFTGVNSFGTIITVSSTADLRVGMPVRVVSGTGVFSANTVIASITSSSTFTVNISPSQTLSGASIECIRIWEQARLNNTGHIEPSGSKIDIGLATPGTVFNSTTNPGVGAFIYRSSSGAGQNIFNGVQLRWNYGANGVTDNRIVSIRVYAVEMVYIPGGVNFNVGGGGGVSAFTSTSITSATSFPTGQTIPSANWPNGYNAFYTMKYEMSQGQYRDFLNTLTYAQQANRTVSAPNSPAGTAALSSSNRNGIEISIPGVANVSSAVYGCDLDADGIMNETTDGEWIACNHINWMDLCAYLDWSGLRPMTEMEYEKACRGDQTAVAGEYAWGSTTITAANNITNGGLANEVSNTVGANIAATSQTNVQGPLRVGVFAGAGSTRTIAGSTYYGVMEMSGNLGERTISLADATGRAYTGVHGDGSLSRNGYSNQSSWPGITSGEVTGATGSGFRGGSWSSTAATATVSDRTNANDAATSLTRTNALSGRGVRTAP